MNILVLGAGTFGTAIAEFKGQWMEYGAVAPMHLTAELGSATVSFETLCRKEY